MTTATETKVARAELLAAFLAAQEDLIAAGTASVDAAQALQSGYVRSAKAAYAANTAKVGKLTLAALVAANVGSDSPYRYNSEASMMWHVAAGNILGLPESGDESGDIVPLELHSLVSRVCKRKGLGKDCADKAAKCATRQAAMAYMRAALTALAPAGQTMADLLVKVAKMHAEGAPVTPETRAAWAALASLAPEGVTVVAAPAPVVAPVALVEAA